MSRTNTLGAAIRITWYKTLDNFDMNFHFATRFSGGSIESVNLLRRLNTDDLNNSSIQCLSYDLMAHQNRQTRKSFQL